MRLEQLGVQAHCLRHQIALSLASALEAVARLGLNAIELVSFPGCRGNPWGDFGRSTDLPPREIAAALATEGLQCPSVMVTEAELATDRLAETLAWILAVGCRRVVLNSLQHPPRPSWADWQRSLERAEGYAKQCGEHSLDFTLHTQPELWAAVDGERPAELLLATVDTSVMRLEYDPSGAIMHGANPAEYLRQRPEAFYAVHLRDGHTPREAVSYLAAEPLGRGSVNWREMLDAAGRSGVEWYFLEMEVADRQLTLAALRESLTYLRGQSLLEDAALAHTPIVGAPHVIECKSGTGLERTLDTTHSRAPKQRRSRESFDRVIEAAIELLKEGGIAGLTLAAVSRRSKVSIGSIYCRVDGKEALIREIQASVIHQMEHEFALLVSRVRRRMLPLPELVPTLVWELAHYLRRHAPLLAAFMQQADRDRLVEEVGRKSYQQNLLDFKLVLLEHQAEFHHPDPEHAAATCFSVVYAALARYLGLSSGAPGHGGAGEGDWRQLVEDLGLMALAFVMLDIKGAVHSARGNSRQRQPTSRRVAS